MSRRAKITWTVIVGIAACAVIGYDVFIDRLVRRTYQAQIALDGKEPFGAVYPMAFDSVILYRSGRNGVTCFDAFRSKDLHERFYAKNGQLVTVEYDTFTDFGKVRGYNVHSIDGFILANGYHVSHPDYAASAGASRAGNGGISPDN